MQRDEGLSLSLYLPLFLILSLCVSHFLSGSLSLCLTAALCLTSLRREAITRMTFSFLFYPSFLVALHSPLFSLNKIITKKQFKNSDTGTYDGFLPRAFSSSHHQSQFKFNLVMVCVCVCVCVCVRAFA